MKERQVFKTAYYGGGENFVDSFPNDAVPSSGGAPFYITSTGKFRAFQQGTVNVHENYNGELEARGQDSGNYTYYNNTDSKRDWLRKASVVEIIID